MFRNQSSLSLSLAAMALLAATMLAGCGRSPRYLTQSKPGVDVSAFETFAIVDIDENMPGTDPKVVRRAKPIIETAIRTTLKAKGYKEAKIEEADFAVVVYAGVLPRPNLQKYGFAPAHAVGNGWFTQFGDLVRVTDDRDEPGEDEIVAVEAYHVKTRELVWFSLSSSIRRPESSAADRIGRARDLVLRLTAEFPTAKAIQ